MDFFPGETSQAVTFKTLQRSKLPMEEHVKTKALSFGKMLAAYNAKRLLDFEMPDGRALRSYTAQECQEAGDWLKTLVWWIKHGGRGKLNRPRTVGDVFYEATLGWAFFAHYSYEIRMAPLRRDRPAPGDEFDGGPLR
jgi:hypothetical protein